MNIRYIVELDEEERMQLQELTGAGNARVRRVKRAQILLAAEQGHGDAMVAATVGVGTSTVYRTKRRFVEQGLEAALSEAPRAGASRKLTGREEALLVAVACSDPPAGRARWTLEWLAEEMVVRTGHERVSRETVRRRLAEQSVKPWQRKMWCIPCVDADTSMRNRSRMSSRSAFLAMRSIRQEDRGIGRRGRADVGPDRVGRCH